MIFFDSHVHIYPEYDLDVLLSRVAERGLKVSKFQSSKVSECDSAKVAAEPLTGGTGTSCSDAGNCIAIAVQLREFQPSLEAVLAEHKLSKWKIVSIGKNGAHPLNCSTAVVTDGTASITILPARQIAAKERIEILGFFGETPVPDGLPLVETIKRVRDASMTPAIAWGLGKWLGNRGKIVSDVIESATEPILVADSALRPTFWCEPLYKVAKTKGIRFLYGSDPLPKNGDEIQAGRYAMTVDAELDTSAPAPSLLAALKDSNVAISPVGRRYGLIETIKHMK